MPPLSRVMPTLALAFLLAAPGLRAGEISVDGIVAVRAGRAEGPSSWLEGGFGRLLQGEDRRTEARGDLQLGFDWRPTSWSLVHAHGLARAEPGDPGGRRAGLAEAFLELKAEPSETTTLKLRGGLLFPGTSRENVGPLWSSPYTLTLSALNTWTAEELRLSGLEAQLRRSDGVQELMLAATAFRGNDSLGALLAWRGWSMGDRLSTAGEILPLPPLASLRPGGAFALQRDDGTRPVGELDGRLGWQARGRWSRVGALTLQASYLDNRGDRGLHEGEYAWATRFWTAGGELGLGRGAVLIAEAMAGDTGMGLRDGPHVDVRYRAGYLLLSWGGERGRLSLRHDRFRNTDRDGTAEPNGEEGQAWTFAAFWLPARLVRVGFELLDLRADRPAAQDSGFPAGTDGRRGLLELRLAF